MDQHKTHDVLLVRTGGAAPYGLGGLAVSFIAIPLITGLLTAVFSGVILLVQAVVLGIDDTRSFYLSMRFDFAMRAKLFAFAVTILYISAACATLVVARYKARGAWADLVALGPMRPAWRRNASVAVLVLIYAVAASVALGRLRERRPPSDGPTDILLLGLLVANYVLFAPIVEEILFRGWLYTSLRRRMAFGPAFFATALLFAAFHWEPRHMVLVLPLAFALGFIREQTGSIRPTIALHASYNMVIVVIAILMQ